MASRRARRGFECNAANSTGESRDLHRLQPTDSANALVGDCRWCSRRVNSIRPGGGRADDRDRLVRMSEEWKRVWREGFAPQFAREGLVALADALRADDPSLIQGATVNPPPLRCHWDDCVTGACAVGFIGWKDGITRVRDLEEWWADTCHRADERLCDQAGCRHFLNWFDDTPRDEVRTELLAEIERQL